MCGTDQRCGRAECNQHRRRLPDDLKAGRPEIPCPKFAGIGSALRHDYGYIAAPVVWKLVHDALLALEPACRAELTAARVSEPIDRLHTNRSLAFGPTSSAPLGRQPVPYDLAPRMILPRAAILACRATLPRPRQNEGVSCESAMGHLRPYAASSADGC